MNLFHLIFLKFIKGATSVAVAACEFIVYGALVNLSTNVSSTITETQAVSSTITDTVSLRKLFTTDPTVVSSTIIETYAVSGEVC